MFAANDEQAFNVIEVLRARKYRIPDDVAVVGFDDVPLAEQLIPPLTTVRIPFTELGRRAADLLLHVMKQDAHRLCRGNAVARTHPARNGIEGLRRSPNS